MDSESSFTELMNFGILLPTFRPDVDLKALLKIARFAERLEYDSLWVVDHMFDPLHNKSRNYHVLEPWSVLSCIAANTEKIRLGTLVLCNQFRHPSNVAKMSGTLDWLSKGRIDVGIGAGWCKEEHISFGFDWQNHHMRLERLEESILIIKKLWTDDYATFKGKYYQVDHALMVPKPVQKPHPPIWVGGNSENILKIVVRTRTNWAPVGLTPEEIEKKANTIRIFIKGDEEENHCLRIAHVCTIPLIVADDLQEAVETGESVAKTLGLPINDIFRTPNQLLQEVARYVSVGVCRYILTFIDFPSLETLKIFNEKVMNTWKDRNHEI